MDPASCYLGAEQMRVAEKLWPGYLLRSAQKPGTKSTVVIPLAGLDSWPISTTLSL